MRPTTTKVLVFLLVCFDLHIRQASSINKVLDINGTFPYLIDKATNKVIEPRDYLDFDNLYAPNETYKSQMTAPSHNYYMIKAFDFANYFQTDIWQYSNEQDLKLSAYPVADESKCAQQLDWLEAKMNKSDALFEAGQQHVNLMTYVDSFGRPKSTTYHGNAYWLGSHDECKRVKIDTARYAIEERAFESSRSDQKDVIKMRYCVGKARDSDWPTPEQDNYVPIITYKVGLCLPESCETLSIKRHRNQLERLMRYNMPEYVKSRIHLIDMYCLPDDRSPVRSYGLSTLIYLSACALWLSILVGATLIHSSYKRQQKDIRKIVKSQQIHADLQIHPKRDDLIKIGAIPQITIQSDQVLSAQNGTNATKANVGCAQFLLIKPTNLVVDDGSDLASNSSFKSRSSTLSAVLNESPTIVKVLEALSISENIVAFKEKPLLLKSSAKLRINLNGLDAIKCLCCILVIFGHIVFIHMQHLTNIINTIEISHELYPRALIAFFNFVDTFFIISGMLTAYFVFKRFNASTLSSPTAWLSVTMLRLLRLSPVYILVFWFSKTMTVHINSGPVWDYGTYDKSNKGLCINDHWWKSILYFGNLGTMQPLCILPAWSIIVDSQYSIIIPPVLFIILKYRKLGYATLLMAVVASTLKMSLQLAGQTAVKPSDMAKVRLHVYPLISRFAAEFYNTAWNRVGPLAVGILGGHTLYLYDIGKIRSWPWFMKSTSFKIVLFMHLLICILPTIGRFTDDPESRSETDTTIFILSNATIKPLWSLINTILLLRLVTDLKHNSLVARLMSHNIWHCLGKLCFASYLIHYEIILVLLHSGSEGYINPNWTNAFREFSLVFLISTLLSYFIYILFEAPINRLVSLATSKRKYIQQAKVDQAMDEETLSKSLESGVVVASNCGLYGDGDDDDDDREDVSSKGKDVIKGREFYSTQ